MFRWFRLLVIMMMLPAYGLAAIAAPAVPHLDAQPLVAEAAAVPAADVSALLAELSDTTDDASDHCLPHVLVLGAAPRPAAAAHVGAVAPVDAPQTLPLRPPCVGC